MVSILAWVPGFIKNLLEYFSFLEGAAHSSLSLMNMHDSQRRRGENLLGVCHPTFRALEANHPCLWVNFAHFRASSSQLWLSACEEAAMWEAGGCLSWADVEPNPSSASYHLGDFGQVARCEPWLPQV